MLFRYLMSHIATFEMQSTKMKVCYSMQFTFAWKAIMLRLVQVLLVLSRVII